MESRPPSIPHPPFPRPSLFSTAPQHSRQYGSSSQQASSRTDARAHTTYDSLRRQENEPSRTTVSALGYNSQSYNNPDVRSQARSASPTRFGAMQSEAAKRSALTSPVKRSGITGKESGFYRDAWNMRRASTLREHESILSSTRNQSRKSASSEPSSAQSLNNRQMPPPSPPQPYPSRNSSASLSHTSQSLFSRDHGLGQTHRPGSSMSISSMLGSDADRPSRDHSTSIFSRPSLSTSPFGTSRPSAGAMSPPTAPARPASSLDHPLLRRSQTPDKPYTKDAFSRQSSRSDSGGLSSEATKFGFGRSSFSQYPEKASNSQKSPHTASDSPFGHSRRVSANAAIQRPNSQPQHEDSRATAFSPRSRVSGDGLFGSAHRHTSSYTDHEARSSLRYGGIYSERAREEQLVRERERERERNSLHEQDSKPSLGLLHGRYGSHPSERDQDRAHTRPSWETGRSQPPSPEARRFTTASEPGSGFGFGAIQSYTKSLGSQLGTSRNAPASASAPPHSSFSLHSRQEQPTPPPHEQPFLGKSQAQPRPLLVTSVPSAGQTSIGASSSAASDEQRRKGSDDLMQHRNLLGLGGDGKRAGRASPLPQAVQGAQAQFMGPASEPGIKGELGRVFAGIGSGVGTGASSSTGSGPSTPMTSSPFKRDGMNGQPENVDDGKNGRGSVALGRKRSSKDEEIQGEGVEQDLRSVSSRGGSRRGRHVHHHHHHHHHHRYKNEEDSAPSRPPAGSTNLELTKTAPPIDSMGSLANAASAHHHHHHHHHHHVPRGVSSNVTSAPAPFSLREARTSVNIEPVLKSVAHLPRHHLGSTLYAPRIGVPSPSSSVESQKFGYTSTPVPIPRFEGKENCTFTVRVPRFRIDPSHREEICARRALWGTGVYTDDSDPVAAAIHSGYIRGEWGEEVDVSMLDLEIKSGYQHAPQPAEDASTTEKPQIPPVPPANKDLHITLLILPRLERYESSLLFGVKSRSWQAHHDGMSFKVDRIEWVDEGSTRGEERSGAARRKRLRNMMQTGRICTGPGLLKRGAAAGSLLGENADIVASQAPVSVPMQPVS